MPIASHKHAESLATRADACLREDDVSGARELYREAADSEQEAVLHFTNAGKPRTFSILAVSHASLLYKSKDLESASRITCRYLGQDELTPRGRSLLKELLEAIWEEQLVSKEGFQYSQFVELCKPGRLNPSLAAIGSRFVWFAA
jgi:hypothetical protein